MDTHLKEITKEGMELLINNKIITQTQRGFVNNKGSLISYTRTKHKRYTMDSYANLASKLAK